MIIRKLLFISLIVFNVFFMLGISYIIYNYDANLLKDAYSMIYNSIFH